MSPNLRLRLAFVAVFFIGGCGSNSGSDPQARYPEPATLAGVYSGELPCSNCAAIAATLWLRADGRFFLRQRFGDDEPSATSKPPAAHAPAATFGLGRWHWDEIAAEAVLRGAGPERRLKVKDEDHLQLRVASTVPHILARDVDAPPFGDRLTLDGESAVSENGATFTECLTGLTVAVADTGAYRELRRQHRRLNPRGKVALTSIRGHLVTVTAGSMIDERLVVDELITLKPGTSC